MRTLPGIYLHWPFCERKCPYCDFYTFGREHPQHARQADFLKALLAEIETAAERSEISGAQSVDTIYFGGGTPSLMGPAALEQILAALHRNFRIAPDAEITMEINPTTAESAELPQLLALGVNRLSVGAQSFDDALLKTLGRVHDAATTRRAIELMRRAGCANLSLDLIFGVPGQSLALFQSDLAAALSFAPEHLSAYNLTLHSGTPFAQWHRAGKLVLPEEDDQLAMFAHLIETLAAAGYGHYEISNWSRPGRASRHNSKYWRPADVYAFGPSAHGVVSGRRFANPPDLNAYLNVQTRQLAVTQDAPATRRAQGGEVMMLALRRVAGAPWGELADWLGWEPQAFYAREISRLRADGLIDVDFERIVLTKKGLYVSDSVMEAFF